MSILPSFLKEVSEAQSGSTSAQTQTVAVIPKEYEMDFETGQLTGRIAEGTEALKVWIWNCLKTQRYTYPIYTWQYGADIEQYVGEALPDEYLEVDLRDEIEDALKVNEFITGIDDWEYERKGSHVSATFTVLTTLGEIKETYDVEL